MAWMMAISLSYVVEEFELAERGSMRPIFARAVVVPVLTLTLALAMTFTATSAALVGPDPDLDLDVDVDWESDLGVLAATTVENLP